MERRLRMVSKEAISALESSDAFDADWYARQYPDVLDLGMEPVEHYLWIGKKLGRSPCAAHLESRGRRQTSPDSQKSSLPGDRRFGIIQHNPLISILIVSFNSGNELKALFPTIANQTYRNFEVILVENGEEDTESLLEQHFEHFQYVKCANVGFAEGNNIAVRASKGELIALVNPDTRLSADALQNLLDAIRYDETAAVVVPKINFFERFVHLRLSANAQFAIQRESVLRGLSYKKLFVRTGSDGQATISSTPDGVLTLDLPYEGERSIDLEIDSSSGVTICDVQVGFSTKNHFTQEEGYIKRLRIDLNQENCSSARYLVNNAGSLLHPDGSPYDRGFGQFDHGAFFAKAYVDAFCGCAALIRRIAILERDLFAGPFFAYYEDSEVSNWLREKGYRILYQPEAHVFHRHSESTEERSLSWNVLVRRSKQLYDCITGADPLPLKHFSFDYPEEFTGPLRRKLQELDREVRNCASTRDIFRPKRKIACVYNTYFSSMGGGEKHALDFASILSAHYDVYLASEQDFDIATLEKYFSVDLSNVRKLVRTNIDTWFTSKFDLFVNSTFRSNLISAAARSIYIVSFPHREVDDNILDNYCFFHNSPFTEQWAKQIWGQHESRTVLPILGDYRSLETNIEIEHKSREILTVGRFTYDGHCKNHHLILNAFKALVDTQPELKSWKLRIIGSCDFAQKSAARYLSDLKRDAKGYNVDILPNADREVLDAAYGRAAIYVHAAGLLVARDNPELHEHFGITTFEAAAHGCLPIVYQHGGPAEQVAELPGSKVFKDISGLQQALFEAMNDWEFKDIRPDDIQLFARAMHEKNRQFAEKLVSDLNCDAI